MGSNTVVPASNSLTLSTGLSNSAWQFRGKITIVTTGGSGTAFGTGDFILQGPTNGFIRNAGTNGTVAIVTNSSQTLKINETANLLSSESFTLQQLAVRIYK